MKLVLLCVCVVHSAHEEKTEGLVHEYIENHNPPGHEQPSDLDVKQSHNVQTCFGQYQASSAVLG